MMNLDERDQAIVSARMAARSAEPEPVRPRTGDWIRFADGIELRIAYVWDWVDEPFAQTEVSPDAGSYHLFESGGCSMSGSLDHGVKTNRLALTGETRPASAWIFHHAHAGAGRGVNFEVPFPVWEYDGPSEDAGYDPRPLNVTTCTRTGSREEALKRVLDQQRERVAP